MADSFTSQYEKILQAHGFNTRKNWLVEVIENDCIVTRVGVYNEILPEPSGNPSGSVLGIKPKKDIMWFGVQFAWPFLIEYNQIVIFVTIFIFNC